MLKSTAAKQIDRAAVHITKGWPARYALPASFFVWIVIYPQYGILKGKVANLQVCQSGFRRTADGQIKDLGAAPFVP